MRRREVEEFRISRYYNILEIVCRNRGRIAGLSKNLIQINCKRDHDSYH